jgi:hypothetical protein
MRTGAGQWVTPVSRDPQREDLQLEVQAINSARRREFYLSRARGTLQLREYGETIARGVSGIRQALKESTARAPKLARFLAMGDSAELFAASPADAEVSMWDAHQEQAQWDSVATGACGHVDGDFVDTGSRNPVGWGALTFG